MSVRREKTKQALKPLALNSEPKKINQRVKNIPRLEKISATIMPMRNILIAVNDSEHSKRAFNFYLDKMRKPGDQLLLAHVVEGAQIPAPTLAHGPSHTREEWDDMMKRLNEEAEKVTRGFVQACCEAELEHTTLSAVGCVGEAICAMIKSNDVDVVIIGNRGLGTIRRTFLGSISDYIVQHSDVPVLVVPPKNG